MATRLTTYEELVEYEIAKKAADIREKNTKRSAKASTLKVLKYLAVMLVVFSLISVLIWRYATINELKYSNFNKKQEVMRMLNTIEELKVQKASVMSIDHIEWVAREKFGMQMATAEQTQTITIRETYALNIQPKGDNMVEEVASEEGAIVQMVRNIADRFSADTN